jgi:hypothetical protein
MKDRNKYHMEKQADPVISRKFTIINGRCINLRSDSIINNICSSDGLALLTVEQQQCEKESPDAFKLWIHCSMRRVRWQR